MSAAAEQTPAQLDPAFADALDTEQELQVVRRRFEQTEDPQARAELAAEALEHVERKLALARRQRRQLDRVEGELWTKRNRLERFLIHERGAGWWHAHHAPAQPEADAAGVP